MCTIHMRNCCFKSIKVEPKRCNVTKTLQSPSMSVFSPIIYRMLSYVTEFVVAVHNLSNIYCLQIQCSIQNVQYWIWTSGVKINVLGTQRYLIPHIFFTTTDHTSTDIKLIITAREETYSLCLLNFFYTLLHGRVGY